MVALSNSGKAQKKSGGMCIFLIWELQKTVFTIRDLPQASAEGPTVCMYGNDVTRLCFRLQTGGFGRVES